LIAQGRKDQGKVYSLTPTALSLDRRCIGLVTAVRWENSLMAIDPCGCQAQLLEKDQQEKLAEAPLRAVAMVRLPVFRQRARSSACRSTVGGSKYHCEPWVPHAFALAIIGAKGPPAFADLLLQWAEGRPERNPRPLNVQ
jgi:hypothetical protein